MASSSSPYCFVNRSPDKRRNPSLPLKIRWCPSHAPTPPFPFPPVVDQPDWDLRIDLIQRRVEGSSLLRGLRSGLPPLHAGARIHLAKPGRFDPLCQRNSFLCCGGGEILLLGSLFFDTTDPFPCVKRVPPPNGRTSVKTGNRPPSTPKSRHRPGRPPLPDLPLLAESPCPYRSEGTTVREQPPLLFKRWCPPPL